MHSGGGQIDASEIYSGGQNPGSSENIDLILPLKRCFIS